MSDLTHDALVEKMARASLAPEVESHVRQIQAFRYASCAMVRDCTKPADDDCLWKGDRDDVPTMMHELEKAKATIRQRAALAAIRDAAGLDDDQMDYAIQEAGMLGGTRWRGEVGHKLAALLRALAGGDDAG